MIERASVENLYIVVCDREKALQISSQAQRMGLDILFPITIQELPFKARGNPYCLTHPGVLVDDADSILSALAGMPVIGASASGVLEPTSVCQPLAKIDPAETLQRHIEDPVDRMRRGIFWYG